jgi:hypothetical protein
MSFTHLLIEMSGWAGAVLILIAYLMLSAGKMDGRSKAYQVMNVVGATGSSSTAATTAPSRRPRSISSGSGSASSRCGRAAA